jgi:hypothetical protein
VKYRLFVYRNGIAVSGGSYGTIVKWRGVRRVRRAVTSASWRVRRRWRRRGVTNASAWRPSINAFPRIPVVAARRLSLKAVTRILPRPASAFVIQRRVQSAARRCIVGQWLLTGRRAGGTQV